MKPSDKAEFVALLNVCYSTALRPLPSFESIDLWLAIVQPYSLSQVRAALDAHMRGNRNAPVPADVLAHLAPAGDGRPQGDEAWAIAYAARDERETVVWTAEMAQAWSVASVLLDTDEIGARVAFRAAYTRLVDEARALGVPVRWSVSLGHDPERRAERVNAAVRAGYLPLEEASRCLPALAAPDVPDEPPGEQTLRNRERLRDLVGSIAAARERRLAERQEAAARAAEATAARKREIDLQVQAYAQARGIRTREPGDDDEEVPHEQRDH